jgi:predicted GIY-YIG superfamily endonuclease
MAQRTRIEPGCSDSQARHRKQAWLVYILRCGDDSFYTGITNNLARRLLAHHAGTASRYTRSRLPVKLVYVESAGSRSAALQRELLIKRMSRMWKERLIGS